MKFSAHLQEPGLLCPATNKKHCNKRFKQVMRISGLVIFLLATSLQVLFASISRSQDMSVEKVSVKLNAEPLVNAIRQIEKQTSLRFFYQRSDVKEFNNMDLPTGRRTVEQTLYELFKHTNLSFRQVDQSILIKGELQASSIKKKISGRVISSDTREAVRFASVSIIRKSDLQIVGQTATDSSGRFQLSIIDQQTHFLRISLLGYHVYSKEIDDHADLVLPQISIDPDPKELHEVIISARSPLISQEVDRLSYNVQSDPESKTSSLLDMLRKVPFITVDADENVKLKGSSSFKVLIDGHESSLTVNNPKDIFRSMSSVNILRIEVITIPPAKYDGEGLAGIINVITVKNRLDGYNANIGASYKFPNGPRSNGNLNFKRGKFAANVYGGWNEVNTPLTTFSVFRQSLVSVSATDQQGSAQTKSKQGFISGQISFEADSLNLFSATANYNAGNSHRIGTILTRQKDVDFRQYRIDNDGRSDLDGYELGVDYQKNFRRNKGQLLSFSYRFSSNENNQSNVLRASELVNTTVRDFMQNNETKLDEHTAQIDYAQPIKALVVEAGVKAIFRNTSSDFKSNVFNYSQDVLGAYNSYQLNLKKWTIKAGLRLEQTKILADFSNSGGLHVPDYTNILPSLALQRKLSKFESLNAGYTERIQRPGILQLNPYVDQQNPYFISYGNPLLKPERNHSFSFTYSSYQKLGISLGLSYAYSKNAIQYISTLGDDAITRGTYGNLGGYNSFGLNVSINYPISNKLAFSMNGQLSEMHLSGVVNQLRYDRDAVSASGFMNLDYNLGHNWKSVFNFQYYSPAVTLQTTSSPYYYTSLGLSKSLLNKKLNISGSFSNPYLKYLDYQIRTTDPRFSQLSHNDIVYRRFNIGLNYQVGKLRDGAVKKSKKTVQNDDIKVIRSVIPTN